MRTVSLFAAGVSQYGEDLGLKGEVRGELFRLRGSRSFQRLPKGALLMSAFRVMRERALRQAEFLRRNKGEVDRINRRIGLGLFVLGAAIYGTLVLVSLVSRQFSMSTGVYLAELVFLAAVILAFVTLRSRVKPEPFFYVTFVSLIVCSGYASAFVTPDYACVTVVFLLFLLPLAVIDKGWRVNAVIVALAVGYIVLAVPYKDPSLQADEVANCAIAALLGIMLGDVFRMSRLENFEMRRQAVRRERYDELTGLLSRRSLFERLEALEDDLGKLAEASILMLDVDRFKKFNDAFGHLAGDACLRRIAGCLLEFEEARRVSFYRYGGEEFLGVVEGRSLPELQKLCDELCRAVRDLGIATASLRDPVVTISVGAAAYEGEGDAANACAPLLSRADIALYQAKRLGRDRAILYAEGMSMDEGGTA